MSSGVRNFVEAISSSFTLGSFSGEVAGYHPGSENEL